MEVSRISKKFQGNFIKHKNECSHIHPKSSREIYENFGNFIKQERMFTNPS